MGWGLCPPPARGDARSQQVLACPSPSPRATHGASWGDSLPLSQGSSQSLLGDSPPFTRTLAAHPVSGRAEGLSLWSEFSLPSPGLLCWVPLTPARPRPAQTREAPSGPEPLALSGRSLPSGLARLSHGPCRVTRSSHCPGQAACPVLGRP